MIIQQPLDLSCHLNAYFLWLSVASAKLSARHRSVFRISWAWLLLACDFMSVSSSLNLSWTCWALSPTQSILLVISCRSSSRPVITSANMSTTSPAVPSTGVKPRDDDVNWGCCLVLDDAPPFCVPIDIIILSKVEVAPIVIPSDIGLSGELDNAFLPFSYLGLGVKSISECTSPEWS